MELKRAIAVLPAGDDVKAAAAFWRDKLGFEVAFDMGDYLGVTRGPVEVHLDGSPQAPVAPVTCRIDLAGVDAMHAELAPKGILHPDEPLETKPWGMRQFSVLDQAGNRITFAEPTGR